MVWKVKPAYCQEADDADSEYEEEAVEGVEEAEEGEEHAKEREYAEDFTTSLLDVWEAFGEDLCSSPSSNASGASGSSDADKASDGSCPGKTESSSTSSSSSSDESPARVPKREERVNLEKTQSEAEVKKVVTVQQGHKSDKRDRANYEAFGMHHLVKRYKDGVCTGYQMSCRVGAHGQGCSKEMSLSVGGGGLMTRVLLKTWALIGQGLTSKALHMGAVLRKDLLDKARQGELLTEPELDELVSLDTTPQPFVFAEPALPSQGSVLGDALEGVPASVHEDCCSMASQGILPVTTPEMRKRNQQASNTDYHVPVQLLPALRFGYISPNLPPPRGMRWRAQRGRWHLAPQGG